MTKFQKHDDILELLLQKHPQLDLSCGGRGQCGKCRLQVTKGFLPVTDAEGKLLSKVQLAQGIRLALSLIHILAAQNAHDLRNAFYLDIYFKGFYTKSALIYLEEHGLAPVSYTHLDVYKRQCH